MHSAWHDMFVMGLPVAEKVLRFLHNPQTPQDVREAVLAIKAGGQSGYRTLVSRASGTTIRFAQERNLPERRLSVCNRFFSVNYIVYYGPHSFILTHPSKLV